MLAIAWLRKLMFLIFSVIFNFNQNIFKIRLFAKGVTNLNLIWFTIVVTSILTAIITGKTNSINNSILSSPAEAVMFSFNLMGNICLWLGIMKIAEKSGLIEKVSCFVKPSIKIIFPEIPEKHPSFNSVTMSLVANMMGIGSASTAFGIKAMQELQKINPYKDTASNSMCMFVVVNSFMIQLIHTNTLFIRNLMGSPNPTKVMPAIIVATTLTLISAVIITRLYEKIYSAREK